MNRTPIRGRSLVIVFVPAVAALMVACSSKGSTTEGGGIATVRSAVTAGCGLTSAPLQLQVLMNSCGANQAQQFFAVTNTGSTPIKLSDIGIKFWIDDSSGQTVVPHVWTGGCVTNVNGNPSCVHQVAGVSAAATSFSPACGPDATHQANWEIAVSDTDGATLPPGATWSNAQVALNLANYSNFSPGTASWFSPCVSGSSYVTDPHFAVYFQGSLVFSIGITAPDCRAPQGSQALGSYVTPAIAGAPAVGPVPPSTVINLAVGVPVPDPAALAAGAHAVSDPTNPSFRQYLTVDQFAATLGPTASNYEAVKDWAQSVGFTISATYPNRLLVDVTATAAQIEEALFANLVFRQRPDGSLFYSLERDPTICAASTVPILFISGLDNRVLATPGGGSAPNGNYDSVDFRAAYASCTTSTGSSQSLGIFALDGYTASDITTYECRSGLATCDPTNTVILSGTVPTVTNVLIDGATGKPVGKSGTLETTADISLAIAMAPGLKQVTVYEAPNNGSAANHNDILNAMASNTSAKQFTSSWFFNVDKNTQPILYAMALQGQTLFQCSGDSGSSSWSGDPGDIRDEDAVTVAGATQLTMTGPPQTYGSETTWNIAGQGASGGGFANAVVIPTYQEPFDLAASGKPSFRQLPDISMVGTGTYVVIGGANGFFAGTSAAAPLWAGYTALANDIANTSKLAPVGFANPFLYFVAANSSAVYNANFNDINDSSSSAGSGQPFSTWTPSTGGLPFTAGSGYDLVTGLGTPKCALLNALGAGTISGGGTGGTGGSGGSGGGGPAITGVTAVLSAGGLDICITGSGLPPGDGLSLTYSKVLGVVGGDILATSPVGDNSVAGDGSFNYDDETFSQAGSELTSVITSAVCGSGGASALLVITDTSHSIPPVTAPLTAATICSLPVLDTTMGSCPLPPSF
jgi:hypothetical protein